MTAPARGVPEDRTFRDTGCSVAPSCLRCPLPACRYDTATSRPARAPGRIERVRELTEAGLTAVEIGKALGITQRSVLRIRRAIDA